MLYYHLSPRESGLLRATGTRATKAILENDIVKKRQTRKNSQISERDNGLTGSESGTEDCEGLNIRV